MSEVTSSDATPVAPVETPSAPVAAVPAFGSSRGSGLARGKRIGAAASATNKDTASGEYRPTAIQLVNHQREYKNPFAPETVPAAEEVLPAKVEQPVANVPAEQPAPAIPAPVAAVETNTSAPAASETKAELKILPPEENARPAQSWEIGRTQAQPPASANAAPRREGRPDFRPERRERQDREGRPENREQRNEFRPRERREGGEQRREQRTFEPKPTAAQTEAKKSGFLGWLKSLFSGETTEQAEAKPEQRREERGGDGRRHEGGGGRHRHHRGGRNRHHGEGRGDFRSENRGPQGEGQQQGGENAHGERHDGFRSGRRHHRGGRNRHRGEGRGGEHRSDGGTPSGGAPAS